MGIAEFGGATTEEKRWGQIASDRLAAALHKYNTKYNRYELVERTRLGAIMDERDLQIAITDTSSAGQAGKLADVQAMIYGSVKVTHRDETVSKRVPDLMRRSIKTVYYTRRYCLVAVNFTMDDIATGKTLATASPSGEFDSDKDTSISKALGFGGNTPPPKNRIADELVQQCVDTFLRQISPHEVSVREKLQGGKSKIVKTGNKLAVAGDYQDALDRYTQGIGLKPNDHGAMFNAGLMAEALGRFPEADRYYTRAFDKDPREQYILARRRVRTEGAEQAGYTR